MQFITNKISIGKGKSFEDIVNEAMSKKEVVKTASVTKEIKVATKEDEGPTSGQPQAEAKLVNRPERDDVPAKGGGKKQEEADSSGQPEAEAKLVNDPEKEEKEVKEAKAKECECKDGETCEKCKEPTLDTKEDKKDEKDDNKDDNKDDDGLTEGQKKLPEALQNAIKNKKSSDNVKFVKIANLDEKTKSFLRDYYNRLWPKEFVDALLADK